jgi:leader peptidase (prepilin peptidase)/N-methyltransferase
MFVLYVFLALTSKNGLGMGDVKLAAPLGLYLGYLGWSQLFYGGALGFVAGGLASAVLIAKNRGNKPQEVPYGPSMLAAGLGVILLLR